MNNLHVKTGDNVMIISGKDKGHTGKVLQVSPSENKVIVEGHNMVTKHVLCTHPRSCPSAPSAARPCVWATSRRTVRWSASARSAALSCKKGVRNNGSFERTVCQ